MSKEDKMEKLKQKSNLVAIGQGGLVSEDALHTREEQVRLGIKHSPIDLRTCERRETYTKKKPESS